MPLAETITIEDFTKIDLRVARVLAAEYPALHAAMRFLP